MGGRAAGVGTVAVAPVECDDTSATDGGINSLGELKTAEWLLSE